MRNYSNEEILLICDNFDQAFSRLAWNIVSIYRATSDTLVKKELESTLNQTLRKWTNKPYFMVSEEIEKLAEKEELNYWNFKYSDKGKLGRVGKKSLIVFEHTTPLSNFINETLFLCKSHEEILREMKNYSRICLISRFEDDRLTELGYKTSRSQGWKKCYQEANIIVKKRKL